MNKQKEGEPIGICHKCIIDQRQCAKFNGGRLEARLNKEGDPVFVEDKPPIELCSNWLRSILNSIDNVSEEIRTGSL